MGTGSLVWPLVRFVLGFAVVVALAAFTSRALARRAGTARGGPFRLLGGVSLGPGRQLCAVQVGRRVLVLGLGDKEVRLLQSIADPAEVAELTAPVQAMPPEAFGRLLAEAAARVRSGGRAGAG